MPAATTTPHTTSEPAPRISGTTTTARAARQAEERAPSEATLQMMPGASDLARELGIKSGKFTPPKSQDTGQADEAEETDEEPAEEETSAESAPEATTEEVEASADTDTPEEAEAEDAETTDEAEDETLPPEAVAIRDTMQKRINKLTAQRTEAQEQIEELQGQLAEAQAGPRPARSADDPLGDVLTERELTGRIEEARAIKRWATMNRDGGELPTGKDGTTKSFDAAEVAQMLVNADAVLDAAPGRQQWLEHQAKAETVAREVAPVFFQKGTPQQQLLDKVWAQVPAHVKAWRPDAKLMFVQMLIGASVMQQQKAPAKTGAAKPQVSVKKAPPAPGGKVAPKAPAKVVEARRNQEQLKKIPSGGHRQLTAAIADRLNFN